MSFFITGIGTEIGKTIASAILVQALKWDYWKPIQSGDLDHSDSHKVKQLINTDNHFFEESYRLKTPLSPHASAKIDNIEIDLEKIKLPKKDKLIIEGAGGLLVPLNQKETIIDLIKKLKTEVIVVSRHYLGSINHTLLTIDCLRRNQIPIKGIIFNGAENKDTESIILSTTKVRFLGRIKPMKEVNAQSILQASLEFKHLANE